MDEREANKYRYQLAVTLQDMAFLKIEMGNYDDALLHLLEVQETLDPLHRYDQVDDLREEEGHLDQRTLHQVENNQGCSSHVEIKSMSRADISCKGHRGQHVRKEINASDDKGPAKVDLTERQKLFGAPAKGPVHEAVLP